MEPAEKTIGLDTVDSPRHRTSISDDLFKWIGVGSLFLVVAISVRHMQWNVWLTRGWTDIPYLHGAFAREIAFVVTGTVLIGFGVPRLWVSAAAGALFGIWAGTAWSMAASVAGSAWVYLLGRTVLGIRPREWVVGRWPWIENQLRLHAFWWVLWGRLFPFSNATVMSLACGAMRVSFAPYLLASGIGFLPLAVASAMFGNGGLHGNVSSILLGFGCIVLTLLLRKGFLTWGFSRKQAVL